MLLVVGLQKSLEGPQAVLHHVVLLLNLNLKVLLSRLHFPANGAAQLGTYTRSVRRARRSARTTHYPRSLPTTLATHHARYYEDHSFLGVNRPVARASSPCPNTHQHRSSTLLHGFPHHHSLQLSRAIIRYCCRQHRHIHVLGLLQCPPTLQLCHLPPRQPHHGRRRLLAVPGRELRSEPGQH